MLGFVLMFVYNNQNTTCIIIIINDDIINGRTKSDNGRTNSVVLGHIVQTLLNFYFVHCASSYNSV